MKAKKLVIVGNGELAMIAYEYFTYDSEYEVCAFFVDKPYITSQELCGLPVLDIDEVQKTHPSSEYEAFVAIPASELNRLRTRFFHEMKAKGYKLATYVSSKAFVWRNAKIGENCFIFEGNVVQPFVEIEDNVVLWSGNHIGHRTVIRANCFLSSHVVVSGYCDIGESCFLGVNSTINDGLKIAPNCILASGSLVNKNLTNEGRVYYGSPAAELPKKSAFNVKL